MDRPRIAIIGAGNVSTHLAPALDSAGDVCQVFARDITHASALAPKLRDCSPIDSLTNLLPDLDFYIISVTDDAIPSVSDAMPRVKGIVAHTSGSVAINALKCTSDSYGVFYPLQTFTKEANVDVSSIPMFVEGSSESATKSLESLAKSISTSVHRADSALRAKMHLAAVFSCNFANNLWAIASDILEDAGLDFSIMGPVLHATLDKALEMNPAKAQTGPAARRDFSVIAKQEAALSGLNKEIYSLLTKSILTRSQK